MKKSNLGEHGGIQVRTASLEVVMAAYDALPGSLRVAVGQMCMPVDVLQVLRAYRIYGPHQTMLGLMDADQTFRAEHRRIVAIALAK